MKSMFGRIDALLRGAFGKRDKDAPDDTAKISELWTPVIVLGAAYGVCMGLYGVVRPENAAVAQLFASMVKVPLLFFLTLCVTLPSLYVFSALHDSKLRLGQTLGLALSASTVCLAVLASFGPVVAFFTLSSDSYRFLVLLNVALFTVAGLIGVTHLRRRLDGLFKDSAAVLPEAAPRPMPRTDTVAVASPVRTAATPPDAPSNATPFPPDEFGPPPQKPRVSDVPILPPFAVRTPTARDRAQTIFRVWTVVFAVVGAQMSWILRPFVGSPDGPFEWFRERRSHFFEAVQQSFVNLFR